MRPVGGEQVKREELLRELADAAGEVLDRRKGKVVLEVFDAVGKGGVIEQRFVLEVTLRRKGEVVP